MKRKERNVLLADAIIFIMEKVYVDSTMIKSVITETLYSNLKDIYYREPLNIGHGPR